MRGIEMSGNFQRLGLLIVTGLFFISVGATFYYYIQSPKAYRKEGWLQIKKEESIAGKTAEISDKVLKGITEKGKSLKKVIVKGKEYLLPAVEEFETGVEPVDELKDKVIGLLKEKKEEEKEEELTPAQEKEIEGLELGPIEKFRYFSDSTLKKAGEIKSRKFRKSLWASIFFGFVDIFFFIGRFPWFGRRDRSGRSNFDTNDLV